MKPGYILKIGGSLLTNKASPETLSPQIDSIIETLAQNPEGIIIHGAGSFGHPHAAKHGLHKGSKEGVLETHKAVKKLNTTVVEKLRENGVKAFPVHPSSASLRNPSTKMMTSQALQMCKEGFTPVLHGDGIVTQNKGFTVLSGDEILAKLEKELDTGHAGFCTSEKGVLNSDKKVINEINTLEEFESFKMTGKDVTGGMENKVRETLEKDIKTQVFGKESLEQFLNGKLPGTTIQN